MKRRSFMALILGLGLMTASAAAVQAANVTIRVDNQPFAVKHELAMLQDRTMIAADDLAVLVNGSTATEQGILRLTAGGGQTIQFKPDEGQVRTGSDWTPIDQGAVTKDGLVYLPLRWTLERLAYQVKWDAANAAISIAAPAQSKGFFTVSPESLTDEERAFVEQVKREKGVHKKGGLYVIARGEVPHPGYGLEIVRQDQSWEQLFVYVRLTKPQPGMMYPQVISYPYLVGRAELVPYATVVFVDADTGGPLFAEKVPSAVK
ncbi:protease complex subunit PrcB family protein [Brevibacillus massiliensis]|jgi:hypothetical protein|uniref:protease complex subunit PrcB family protein n=1 Tax=Brevibacillus massiliensis TaxID=1118054 RepID=UPI00047532A0|nr:protease complex subunit PrcB family protein [Brevibacillus massiliensis]